MYQTIQFDAEGTLERTIAWIDNTIDKFDSFMRSFSRFGSKVIGAANANNFISEYKNEHIDHLLLDYDFLGSTGFDELPLIIENCNIKNIYICTAYSYRSHIDISSQAWAAKNNRKIGTIPKEFLPFTDQTQRIKDFLRDLDCGRYLNDLDKIKHHEDAAIYRNEFPTYEEYQEYTIDQRIEILRIGKKIFQNLIEMEFNEGNIWLLIDAKSGAVVRKAKNTDGILMEDDLNKLIEDTRIIPLVYSKSFTLDTFDNDNDCKPNEDMRRYSALGVSNPKEQSLNEFLHFDNGNSYSLFAYEYFLERGWYKTIINPAMREHGELVLYGKDIKIDDATVTDSHGNSAVGAIMGFAVINWPTYRMAIRCIKSCGLGKPYPSDGNYMLCNRRKGLLGRNLGLEINRNFLLDTCTGKILLKTRD